MHIPWGDVELLLAVADAGSLSAAAKTLGVTQPTISRRLADVEAALGEAVFMRAVDGTSLTSFGERLLGPARRMADAARELDDAASGADTQPRGVVRLTAPPGVAFDVVAPFAALLREQLPAIRLEVVSTVAYLDLARREADLGLRSEPLDRASRPRDLVTLASVQHGVVPCATAAYAASLPARYGVADVGWVGWAPPFEHVTPNPQLAALIPGFRPVFASDDYLVQIRAAEAGVGAILRGMLSLPRALATPLVPLALDVGPVLATLHLVASRASLAIPRVRAVADLLAAHLETALPRARRR